MKQNPEWRSRLKKDPGIPNLFPYKDKILHEIEEKRRLKEEEYARKREEAKQSKVPVVENNEVSTTQDKEDLETASGDLNGISEGEEHSADPMSALLASARARAVDFEGDDLNEGTHDGEDDMSMDEVEMQDASAVKTPGFDNSLRAHAKTYKTVLENSDIILYVLDARDPLGTRSREIEQEILTLGDGSKRLLLILNKIDLIPPDVLKRWLAQLRRTLPTIPLRANTPAPNAHIFDHKAFTVRRTTETLLKALKSYAQSKQLKRSTTVGIIGYPNVGKSSVINALKSRLGSSRKSGTSCPVGAEAGVTTALREVKLDNKLTLIDSPGIVFPPSSTSSSGVPNLTKRQIDEARLVLLSAVPPSSIDDPIPAISLLLDRLSQSSTALNHMMDYYKLSEATLVPQEGDITTDFLVQVARRRGRLGKGGVPNVNAAAKTVLADWRDGRIRGWVEPPSAGAGSLADESEHKEVVQQWSEEFKLEGLWGDDQNGVEDEDEAMQQ